MRLPTVQDVERLLPRPEQFESRARGTGLTARVGSALGICFAVCFLTGLWSHVQYSTPGWLTLSPHPTQLYRWTQGLHIISGTAAIPLLLVKLWSVFPRLFARQPFAGKISPNAQANEPARASGRAIHWPPARPHGSARRYARTMVLSAHDAGRA